MVVRTNIKSAITMIFWIKTVIEINMQVRHKSVEVTINQLETEKKNHSN